MVHPNLKRRLLNVRVDGGGDEFAPPLHLDTSRWPAVQLLGFVRKTVQTHALRRRKNMDVPVQPILGTRTVDAGLGCEPVATDQSTGDLHGQLGTLKIIELAGQGKLEFAQGLKAPGVRGGDTLAHVSRSDSWVRSCFFLLSLVFRRAHAGGRRT